jgi:hypothetical protein
MQRDSAGLVHRAMKRRLLHILAATLGVLVTAVAVWVGVLYANHGSLSFHRGSLAANDQFLDGSGDMFQRCSWHLGNATRTWGETYGVNIFRGYVTVQVTHRNPQVTPQQASEDQ